jgi:hypothetical protein
VRAALLLFCATRSLRFGPLLLCGVLTLATTAVAAESKRAFDVPAGRAEETLRRFSEQAGVELGFNSQHVQGIRTRAVRGHFSPAEGLDLLLAGSPLQAVRDAQTGAIFVNRKPPAAREPSARTPRQRPPPAAATTVLRPPTDDAVVLNPFVIEMARDESYASTATLAGTRLNTPLRDIGSAISIYRKNLLSDLGIASHQELMIYALGMEAAGPAGNFSNGADDIHNPQVVGDGVRTSPQTQWRVRGLAAPNATRGYFLNDIAGDAYNTEAITISRGPNAVLFGVGSPAGVVDIALLKPLLARDETRVEFRVGDNGSVRQVLDVNRAIVPHRLALRLVTLRDEERFDQRPAFENKRRLYGALTFEPTRTTSLRAHLETGYTRANRPFQVLPFNSISDQWYAAGRPTWDWNFYDDPARNPAAGTQDAGAIFNASPLRFLMGQAQIFGGIVTPFPSGDAVRPDLAFRSTTPMGSGPNAVRIGLVEPNVNRDAAFDTIAFYETFNLGEIPAGYYADNRRPADLKFQGFTDYSAFDFRHRQIDETGRQADSFHTFTLSAEQRAWKDRLGVEAAYYRQHYDTRHRNPFFGTQGNANHVRIDVNQYLPDGRANPNVGRPYAVLSQQQFGRSLTQRETLRFTGFARYDLRDPLPVAGRWLGRHTLTALHERAAVDALSYFTTFRTTGPAADQVSANLISFNRLPNHLVYLGDSVLDGRPLRLNPIRAAGFAESFTAPTAFFSVPADGSSTQATLTTVPTSMREVFTNGFAQREIIRSHAAVLQSHWLDDLLVTTAGWRRDADHSFRETLTYDPARPDVVHRGFGDVLLPKSPPLVVAKDVQSFSAVLHWPRRLAPLPRGIDASVFVSSSENFSPLGNRVNFFNERLPAPVGRTRERGMHLELFDGRLTLRYTRFQTRVAGASYATPFNYQNAIIQMTGFWHLERNLNPHIDRTEEIEQVFSVLPPNLREVYQFTYSGTPEERNLGRSNRSLSGVTDTTDYLARGHEFELTFSPTPQLRLLANIAHQRTTQQNIAPFTRALVERLRPVWDRLADRPRTNYPANFIPGSPLPANIETVGQYVAATVYVPYATMIASEGSVTAEERQWHANAIANYAFPRDSRLRGWSLGGGLRWQSRIAVGYPAGYDSAGNAQIALDRPYFGPSELNVDFFGGYTRRLWRERVEWKIQLNLRNALGRHAPIPVTAQPDGTTASARLPPEQRWYLTNTFTF